MAFDSGIDSGTFGTIGLSLYNSELMQVLLGTTDIVPGSSPGYEACKTIYAYHPLGSRMVDKPLEMAFSQNRKIEMPGCPQEDLLKAFDREWAKIGAIGANAIITRAMQLSRIYGISTLACNTIDKAGKKGDTNEPLPYDKLHELDLYFNIYDPLNTAGSLVLNQDPEAVDFMRPRQVRVGSNSWAKSKCIVMMHEQPIWIEWTDSAFGFVGRSVYQRAFYPLKSFMLAMITDNLVQEKLGLIVHKAKSPGSILDKRVFSFFGLKRQAIQGAQTGNVVQIGIDEDLASLNLEHVATAGEYSRNNILKNIATGAGMPSVLLNEETLTQGFGEGSEDAKQVARYIDGVRIESAPIFEFMDKIVQHRAWSPEFYDAMKRKYPEVYSKLSYDAALHEWQDSFKASWPNLLEEPDSEKVKTYSEVMKHIIASVQVALPQVDPENRATMIKWMMDTTSNVPVGEVTPLTLDEEALAAYDPPQPESFGEEPPESLKE